MFFVQATDRDGNRSKRRGETSALVLLPVRALVLCQNVRKGIGRGRRTDRGSNSGPYDTRVNSMVSWKCASKRKPHLRTLPQFTLIANGAERRLGRAHVPALVHLPLHRHVARPPEPLLAVETVHQRVVDVKQGEFQVVLREVCKFSANQDTGGRPHTHPCAISAV
jgi:hypothetical protein